MCDDSVDLIFLENLNYEILGQVMRFEVLIIATR
jgi:hypothetical protein